MRNYLAWVILLPLAVAAAVYYSSAHWLPLFFGSWENLDTSTKRELLKVAPTAIAAMFGSIVAAITAVALVGLQRNASLRIETRKGEILDELEEKKNTLAGQLDKKRQELQQKLGIARQQIDEKVNRLNEARSSVSEYRSLVQMMRSFGDETGEIKSFQKKLIQLRDSFTEFPELYKTWADFHQKGFYLCERMETLRSAKRRRAVWDEISQQSPLTLGVEFGNSAQEVLARLEEVRNQVVIVP